MFLGSMGGADAISRDRCRYIALSRFRFLSRCVSLSFLISVATPFYIDFPVKNMYIYIYIYTYLSKQDPRLQNGVRRGPSCHIQ